MRLAKKLACLALAGVIALAQVPVTALAKTTGEVKFPVESKTLTNTDSWKVSLTRTGVYAQDVFAFDWWIEQDEKVIDFNGENNGFGLDSVSIKAVKDGEATLCVAAYVRVATESELEPGEVDKFLELPVTVKLTNSESGSGGSGTTTDFDKEIKGEVLKITQKPIPLYVGDELEPEDYLTYEDPVAFMDINYSVGDKGIATVDGNGVLKAVANGTTDLTVSAVVKVETKKASESTIRYWDTAKIKVTVRDTSDDSSSDDSSSGGGSGSGSSSGSGSGAGSGSAQSPSGATLASNTTTAADGTQVTTTTVSLGGKTMTVVDQVKQLENGATQRTYAVSGDVSGLTFSGVGTVSADGATLTTPEGMTFTVVSAPMSVITYADGTTVGCFVDAAGNPISFGADTVVMQLGADGQMHGHWVKADGTFYTGMVIMNGMMITFNDEGVMVSYSALAM